MNLEVLQSGHITAEEMVTVTEAAGLLGGVPILVSASAAELVEGKAKPMRDVLTLIDGGKKC